MSNYIEYDFVITPLGEACEILVAELAEFGFESFVDSESGILAYVQEKDWYPEILDDIYILKNPEFKISYTQKLIKQVNWNEQWEKNFNPITVNEQITVRAPFHEKTNTPFDIVIEPKMSFGTGHHETTHMMLEFLLNTQLLGKKVLDMGCGTGVLAIMAAKKGATDVTAIDIDTWCYENAQENIQRNETEFIKVLLGDATLLNDQNFDVIIANINRNILLEDIPIYVESLCEGGTLFLSGFYQEDIPAIAEKCSQKGLTFVQKLERNRWVALQFNK
ncbi:Ribosomal protein L11 methyltransferase [Capnocytophaga canimorsus]|uniref:Ribosomal protein L11 methyltransferase n=1 Tax=Capnocytophaga canimorsus TaxID=28188 RepID=A0A0B7HTG1_9FLAO|nr:50S ribosomal protein L11 methyltransferase [Capnocytophaga canimorsus]ATA76752.1 50S ribosomal protein L11 methyltransferase [Capnocytophaga canimorsus]PJI84128.1 ribosomal protein L11 methyltransferase [Capnocytophaga canimorsus]CEN40798.1 Ribosomal protein L11 methyltransferase [Capnocytophaga canimorsus]STA71945.1 Ribosomal protein L11 methyltransferase [Capnocytophaga canimorsus]